MPGRETLALHPRRQAHGVDYASPPALPLTGAQPCLQSFLRGPFTVLFVSHNPILRHQIFSSLARFLKAQWPFFSTHACGCHVPLETGSGFGCPVFPDVKLSPSPWFFFLEHSFQLFLSISAEIHTIRTFIGFVSDLQPQRGR